MHIHIPKCFGLNVINIGLRCHINYFVLCKYIYLYAYTQGSWKVTPYCESLHLSRCCECRRVPHYTERGNLASHQYLGEYWGFNFHANDVPPHLAIAVREWLNGHVPGRWMSDLAPCDLFLGVVWRSKSTLPNQRLEGRIRDAMPTIQHEFLVKSVDAVPSRQSSVGLRSWWRMLVPISNFK